MKHGIMLRLLMYAMTLVLVFGGLASCGNNAEEQSTDIATEVETDKQDSLYDFDGYLKDSLPEQYKWNDTFTLFSWQDQLRYEFIENVDESYDYNAVDRKLIERVNIVEERFGISFEIKKAPGAWDNRNSFITTISNSIKNGDQTYDLIGQYTPTAGIGITNGLYRNLKDSNSYLDLEKPWWPTHMEETSTIGEKLYNVTGEITATALRNIHCMFVNLDCWEDFDLSSTDVANGRSIYDIVFDYDWTFENMITLGTGLTEGVENFVGIHVEGNSQVDAFLYGAGFKMLENKDGNLILSEDLGKLDIVDFFSQVKALCTNQYDGTALGGELLFGKESALFSLGVLSQSEQYSKNGIKFSILPTPMRTHDQGAYYTCANLYVTQYSVPTDVKSYSMSTMILEALGSYAYRLITDEYYYDTFKMRYNSVGGENSAKMFDIVADSLVFDTSRMFADALGSLCAVFRGGVIEEGNPTGTWVSIYAPNKDTWIQKIDDLFAKVG